MTNEQMAVLIGEGGNDELIPLLWDKVKKFVHSKADSYYYGYRDFCDTYGIDKFDLRQASYSAFLKAIPAYYKDRERGYKLLSYLRYHFLNEIRRIKTRDKLNGAKSLDAPIGTSADGDEITLGDVLTNTSGDIAENIENKIIDEKVTALLREAVDRLPEQQRAVIQKRYYEERTLKNIAEELELSSSRIQQIERKAIKALRKAKEIRAIYSYSSGKAYHDGITGFKQRGFTNVELIAMKRADAIKRT